MKISDLKLFKIIYSIFILLIFSTLTYIISNLFSQISPYMYLEKMYDNEKIYIFNYSYLNTKLYDENDVMLYRIDFVNENDNYYTKIVMNKNAAKFGYAYDDFDTLYVIKGDFSLEENVLYSNDKSLNADKYVNYPNIEFKNNIFNVNYDINYLYVDDNLTLADSTIVITDKTNVKPGYFTSINSRYINHYIFDGAGFKAIIKSKFDFKISMVLVFAVTCIITLIFSLLNMFDNYIKIYKDEIIIKNIYYKSKRKLILEYTFRNFIFSIIFICIGTILGFLIQKNINFKYILLCLAVFFIVYYLVLWLVMKLKISKINIFNDSRGLQ